MSSTSRLPRTTRSGITAPALYSTIRVRTGPDRAFGYAPGRAQTAVLPAAAYSRNEVLRCNRGNDGDDHASGRDGGGSPRDAKGRPEIRARRRGDPREPGGGSPQRGGPRARLTPACIR